MRALSRVGLVVAGVFASATAYCQTTGLIYENVVVTSASSAPSYEAGYSDITGAVFGSITPATTIEGYGYTVFRSAVNPHNDPVTTIEATGFTSSPGAGWLSSITCGGVTDQGSQATFEYISASGSAAWTWSSKADLLSLPDGTPVSCQIIHQGNSGWVRPKFIVVGVTYAPPGSKSSANYVDGFMTGTGTTNSSSFTSSTNVSIKLGAGVGLFGLVDGTTTGTVSAGWSQEQDSSSSLTVTEQNSTGLIVPGPASSGLGVDHIYDTIYVWLNPAVFIEFGGNNAYQSNYAYDARDPIGGMDVLPVMVGELTGALSMPSNVQQRLDRTWDSALGAPTSAELTTMIDSDPFEVNSSFNPNTDTSGRFELPESGSPPEPTDLIFNYVPVAAGGQATGETYTSTYTSTSSTGQGAKETQSTSFSIDSSASASFIAKAMADFSVSQQYTTVTQWSKTITNSGSQTANFTIFPPLASDNYTGPTAMQVWKDNVYGTFMFYPE
jgi:hypothetical protein